MSRARLGFPLSLVTRCLPDGLSNGLSNGLLKGLLICALALVVGCNEVRVAPKRSQNVLVVVLDAARADHFGVYGYPRETTPAIDAFALAAMRYERVLAEAPFTFVSTSALFAAASPAETGLGARSGGRVPQQMRLIAEIARDNGYATLGYSENPYVTGYFGMDQGFEIFEEGFPAERLRAGRELDPTIDSRARAQALLDRALAEDRPFFAYLHLLRPHNPYAPPAPFAGRFGSTARDHPLGSTSRLLELDRRGPPYDSSTLERIIALYDENLAYADSIFGHLLEGLREAGADDETIVVLTADHGEAFGEHGRLLHSTQLYDPMLHVPLLVRIPGVPARVDASPLQLADLGRGLAKLFEGAGTSDLARLADSRPAARPLFSWTNAATHHAAAWTPERRVIVDAQTGEVVAYHAYHPAGAGANFRALDREGEALRSELARQIDAWTGRSDRVVSSGRLDPEKRRQLEALGYVEP